MDFHFYFAYGSNMNVEQMQKRCPSAKVVVPSLEFKDMQLVFAHKAKIRDCGVASIKKVAGKSTFGTLYTLNSDDLIKLDRAEGLGNGYSRKFQKGWDGVPDFWYYYSLKNHRNEFHEPSEEYLGLIIEGAQEQNLPASYIDKLKSTPTVK